MNLLTTPPEGIKLRGSTRLSVAIAEALVNALPDEVHYKIYRGSPHDYINCIRSEAVTPLAELFQEIVAYTVASLIDAGGERSVVMGNDELRLALEAELRSWTGEPQ